LIKCVCALAHMFFFNTDHSVEKEIRQALDEIMNDDDKNITKMKTLIGNAKLTAVTFKYILAEREIKLQTNPDRPVETPCIKFSAAGKMKLSFIVAFCTGVIESKREFQFAMAFLNSEETMISDAMKITYKKESSPSEEIRTAERWNFARLNGFQIIDDTISLMVKIELKLESENVLAYHETDYFLDSKSKETDSMYTYEATKLNQSRGCVVMRKKLKDNHVTEIESWGYVRLLSGVK